MRQKRDRIQWMQNNNDQLKQQVVSLQQERDHLFNQNKVFQKKIDLQAEQIMKTEELLHLNQRTVKQKEQIIDQLSAENARLQKNMTEKNRQLHEIVKQTDDLLHSKSWLLTSPFRTIVAIFTSWHKSQTLNHQKKN
ncbi:hypothetical protein ACFL27_08755 [candidate division CSSED10-310 bacterium]|uniref:Uncharacterized protein n=1 Tax=candidate division CSSED10-310 bacterium TaxID=2855610 RepID=A0ABV6YVN9_UNCC1